MKLRVFTLRYDIAAQHFDDTTLRQFFETGVDALEVRDHMVTCDGQSVLVLLVTYRDTNDARSRQGVKTQKAPNVAKQELCDEDMVRFERIRAWRNARAHRDGKPPYVLFVNGRLTRLRNESRRISVSRTIWPTSATAVAASSVRYFG